MEPPFQGVDAWSVPEKRKIEHTSKSYGSTPADGEDGKEPHLQMEMLGPKMGASLICQQSVPLARDRALVALAARALCHPTLPSH